MLIPTVSVCLPNLNNREYLEERLQTIRDQTLTDWELIISDNFSDDGAWELLSEAASRDTRIRAFQTPRGGGMYPNWNVCLRAATGRYVYIATSDDTMPPDCLERLVAALESFPECDIAHCPLKTIDPKGQDLAVPWYNQQSFIVSSGTLTSQKHIRQAPFDGLLHLIGNTVYISITQLLIRRTLIDRIGLFEHRWGSMCDFEWGMRASLVASTIHVPETWGGWRIHPMQATATLPPRKEHRARCEEMIDHAVQTAWQYLSPETRNLLTSWKRGYLRERAEWWLGDDRSIRGRIAFHIRGLLTGRRSEWDALGKKLGIRTRAGLTDVELITAWCAECGVTQPLRRIDG